MSRRDTIIISVLINAGLLAILFSTAWHGEEERIGPRLTEELSQRQESLPLADAVVAQERTKDEIDKVIQKFAAEPKKEAAPTPKPTVEQQIERLTQYGWIEVAVKVGDTLESIASMNGVTAAELRELNQLYGRQVQVGEKLRVPTKPQGKKLQTEKAPATAEEVKYYTVQPGDNPWLIARKQGVPLAELLRLNDLDDSKARRLKAGDKLRIR